MKNELLTSEEWQDRCYAVILDPDGWDRKNFKWSWSREKITQMEFEKRLTKSTIMFQKGLPKEGIWK